MFLFSRKLPRGQGPSVSTSQGFPPRRFWPWEEFGARGSGIVAQGKHNISNPQVSTVWNINGGYNFFFLRFWHETTVLKQHTVILLELSISGHTAMYRLIPVERKHHRGNLGMRASHGESILEERAFFVGFFFFLVSKIMQHSNIYVESELYAHFLPSLEVDLGTNPSSTWFLLLKLALTTGCSITEQKKPK